MTQQNLQKALQYAAISSKIRACVCEGLTPAVPYILRFRMSDYTYFIDYMRDTIFAEIKATGMMKIYMDVASTIASDLGATEFTIKDLPPPEGMTDEETEQQLMADLSLGQPDIDAPSSASNRTPYMLSQYYGNVWPLGMNRLQMVTDEEGFWSKLRDVPLLKINGIAMSPDQALQMAIQSLCLNLDAFANMPPNWKKKHSMRPSAADVPGAFSFPSFPKLKEVDGADVLDAIIVLECTAFINKVIALKEDPEDYDFPFNFANGLWKTMFPKSMPEWVIQQFAGTYPNKQMQEQEANSMRFPKKICYVPVLDHVLGEPSLQIGDERETLGKSAAHASEILKNFPWQGAASAAYDGILTPKDAEKRHPKINWSKALYSTTPGPPGGASSRIPTISATIGKKITDHTNNYFDFETGMPILERADDPWTYGHIEDKYNGGMVFHARRGGLLLQYFCKVDTELWERVSVDEFDNITLAETKGFRNLLYLYANRSKQLKGHVNPHYWNACMKAFFDRLSTSKNLSSKTNNTLLDYSEADLDKFRGRMGADYANVRMGLRMCWVVPSNMLPDGDSDPARHPTHPSGRIWHTKHEYGDAELLKAYKSISKTPQKHEKMQEMFMMDKAHAYAVLHQIQPQMWDKPTESNLGQLVTIKESLAPITATKRVIPEYCFVFPLMEVLTDKPVPLNPNNWNIQKSNLSLRRGPNTTVDKLLKKMSEHPDFKILLDYIFPLNSIIPEIATIYGMEFFKTVGDYMKFNKNYFQGVKEAADSILGTFDQIDNPNHFSAVDFNPNMVDGKK